VPGLEPELPTTAFLESGEGKDKYFLGGKLFWHCTLKGIYYMTYKDGNGGIKSQLRKKIRE
jgi:hypothetical protein